MNKNPSGNASAERNAFENTAVLTFQASWQVAAQELLADPHVSDIYFIYEFGSSTPTPRAAMAKKKIMRGKGDIREHPRYSVVEAAADLGISPNTLYSWISPKGNKPALIRVADPANVLLSFYNLVEAYVLLSTRRRGLPMSKVRTAVEYMNEKIGGKHPLATYRFATSGKGMFVKHLEGKTVDASRFGQPAIGDMLDRYLRGIKRGPGDRMPIEIRPLKAKTLMQSPVVINPYISSGSPVIKGTGIIASTLWKRAKGGETLHDLASDYDLKLSEVQKVIDYLDAAA